MTLTIPDSFLLETNISPIDFRIELACYMYKKKRLSIGKARKVAGLNLIPFQKELAKRNIYINLMPADVDLELQNLAIM
jgi:predicted HTH domain antitoxin